MNFRRSKFLVNVSLLGMALLFQLLPAVSSQTISCRQAMLKLLPSEVSRQLIFQDELLNKYTQKGFVFNGKSFDSVYKYIQNSSII